MNAVFDAVRVAVIREAGRQPIQQPNTSIDLPQQQSTAVRRDPTAVETTDDFPSPQGVKLELLKRTLCPLRPLPLCVRKCLVALTLCTR
jgi:hypothetical protein